MADQDYIKRCHKCQRQFVGAWDETHCNACKPPENKQQPKKPVLP